MKKIILSALIVLSAGIFSAFTVKSDTAIKHDSTSTKKEYSTADTKQSPRHTAVNTKKEYSTAD